MCLLLKSTNNTLPQVHKQHILRSGDTKIFFSGPLRGPENSPDKYDGWRMSDPLTHIFPDVRKIVKTILSLIEHAE